MGIKKVFLWLIPVCAIIALVFYGFGVKHIEFGDSYYRFFQGVLQIENQLEIQIPNIPSIPPIENGFVDVLIGFINGITTIINVLINIMNISIQILLFLFSIIVNVVMILSDRSIFPITIVASSL